MTFKTTPSHPVPPRPGRGQNHHLTASQVRISIYGRGQGRDWRLGQ